MTFLLRFSTDHQYVQSPSDGPSRRRSSPLPGSSVLMTSAPNSAIRAPQKGPATMDASSSTRMPSKGRRPSLMLLVPPPRLGSYTLHRLPLYHIFLAR